MMFQIVPALIQSLNMGIDFTKVVNPCPRQAEQAMVYLDVFLSDDTAVIAMDEVIDIGDSAGR